MLEKPNSLTPQERYARDASFHQFVDLLESLIEQLQFTPTEIREAAMLAALHYDVRQVKKPWTIPAK